MLYTDSQLTESADVVYSTRANPTGQQYVSDATKSADRSSATLALTMDIWVPPNATASAPQPLIIHIHGGGFVAGSKQARAGSAMSYARAGYVAATINYRLTANNTATPATRIAAITSADEDLMNAIRFLKANAAQYHIDPTRIATIGGSAGGGLSLINAVQYDDVDNVVSDFPGVSSKVNAAISSGATLVSTDVGYDSDDYLQYDASDSPVLLFHANPVDPSTGATWTDNVLPTQQRINDSGNTCTAIQTPADEHVVDMDVEGAYWSTIQPFLATQLRL
ncbi:MAG TPA: alpha/beta hydrolase [Ideonella sp.]|nr:alpha/beta hydrolase [Ideonella sp.]